MSTEDFNDNMHRFIVERLEERKRKIENIERFERSKNSIRTISIISLAVAACFVGAVFITHKEPFSEYSNEPIRTGSENIQRLIDTDKFEEALSVVEKEIAISDSTLKELKSNGDMNDEETIYEIKACELRVKELINERDALKKKLK